MPLAWLHVPPRVPRSVTVYCCAKQMSAANSSPKHTTIATLTIPQRRLLKYPIVLDGRNLYDPATMVEHPGSKTARRLGCDSLDIQNEAASEPQKCDAGKTTEIKIRHPTARPKYQQMSGTQEIILVSSHSYSRRNALKHGLFIRDRDEFCGSEDPREFRECYKRLRDELQPVGPCEEIEVEHIAICWLRLQRLWRYENAEVEAGKTSVARNVEKGLYHPLALSPTRATQMSLLRTAEKEAEVSGQISPELKEKIFSEDVSLGVLWPSFEARTEKTAQKKRHDIAIRIAEERRMPLSEAKALLVRDPKSLPERERFVAVETVREVFLVGGGTVPRGS